MSIDRINKKFFLMAVGNSIRGKESDIDIAVRCPICGDSHKKKNSTRLHLYHKNGSDLVHCFNGDCILNSNRTVYSFLRDHYPNLLAQYKRENFGQTMEKLAQGDSDVFAGFKKEQPKETADITVHDLTPYLQAIDEVPEALEYLKNRGCDYKESKFGKWYFGNQDLKIGETLYPITGSIIIPLYYNDQMYGFYSRSIYDKMFYTYNPEQNIGYKIWNWFNIDKNKPVYIYEAIFDAIAGELNNSIALMGAKIPDDRLNELKYPVFVLDNDKTGLLNSLEYCRKGHQVYIQPDKYPEKDMNEFILNYPEINVSDVIISNLYTGISAEVRIKSKL